jgi:ABC-2 type transport system permease protein
MRGYLEDYTEGVEKLYHTQIQGFIIFPKGFEKELLSLRGANLNLYLNTTRFLPSNDLNKAVNEVMLTIGSGIRLRYYESKGLNPKHAMELINPILADVRPAYNVLNSYGNFLLPGLFFLILQQTLLLGLGESVAADGENSKLVRTISRKGGIASYLFGKQLYYLLLFASLLFFFFTIIFPFFDLAVQGSIPLLFVVSMLFIGSISLLAFLVGTFVKSQIRIMEILAFTTYPFFLISGYSWPISAMPQWVQWLSDIVPTTHIMVAIKKIAVMGGGFKDVVPQIISLLILTAVLFVFSVMRLLWLKEKRPD